MPHAMQHIGKNNITFGFRILLPFLLIWFFRNAIQYMLNLPFEKTTIPMIFVIGIIHLWLILFLVIGLFYKVSNVDIRDQELITGNLIEHKRVIDISDIIGYSTTTYMTISYRGYTGLLLYLNSGKVVELTEYNIKTIKPIYSTFLEGKIKHFGHEMSWFPFRPFKYKFKDIAKHAA